MKDIKLVNKNKPHKLDWIGRMNLPPESTNYNSDERDFGKNKNSAVSNPLENLLDLLAESILEENQTEQKSSSSNFRSTSKIDSKLKDSNQIVSKDKPHQNIAKENPSKPLFLETEFDKKSFSESSQNSSDKKNIESPKIKSKLESNINFEVEKNKKDRENKTNDSHDLQSDLSPPKNSPKQGFDLNKIDKNSSTSTSQITVSSQWIIEKERQIDELANYVNSLIPLMVQLSAAENNNSQESIQKAIVPIIDRAIQQRSEEDREKMAMAIAAILPDAIRQEIINAPESIGKAIAPEIALSIKEQTIINEGAIAEAMGSEMGKAIKNQIETERDAMVDALYPVIGSTISKYMNEVVASINEKVDATLSLVGIKRKIRAKIQGVSEAELILQESVPSSIRAIFLIHNNSGLVIRELQPSSESPLESDLLAGMLTAIRSFANDCIAANSELDEIDYGNFQILFETAGYCYLAVVVDGEPIRQFRDRMRDIFSEILLKYGDEIEKYQGNPDSIPDSIQSFLEELVYQSVKADYNKPSKALFWLMAILLGVIIIPWGVVWHRGRVAKNIQKTVAVELDATPELSVYRLTPKVKRGKLSLTGRVPSTYLKNLAAQVSQEITAERNLELDNQIVAVNVPVDPTVTTGEIVRLTKLLNQEDRGNISTEYRDRTVTIDSLFINETERQNLIAAFSSVPGVEKVILIGTQQLPTLDTKIYFPSGNSQFLLENDSAKIDEIEQFLNKYPAIKLRIIGHSDRKGVKETNLKLAKTRADSVYQAIIDRGIDPSRLDVVASPKPPPDLLLDLSQPLWLSRCVRFESFVTEKN